MKEDLTVERWVALELAVISFSRNTSYISSLSIISIDSLRPLSRILYNTYMKLQGTLTERDFFYAALVKFNKIIKIRVIYALILILSIFVLMDVTYMGVTFFTYVHLIFLVFFASLRFIVLPMAVKSMYKESIIGKLVHVEVLIDDEGIKSNTEYRKTELKWKAFKTFSYNKNVLLLYPYGGSPMFISRSLISSDNQWNKLIDLSKKHLPLK